MAVKTQSVRGRLLASTLLAGIVSVGLPAAVTLTASALPTMASAQDYTSGILNGVVTDDAGAPVSGATVSVVSGQGTTRTTTTGADGSFRIPALPVGQYTANITANGQSISQRVTVAPGSASYAFNLPAAGAGTVEELVVTAARRTEDFTSTDTGLTVDVQELAEHVPVGRTITAVTLLTPGASVVDPSIVANGVRRNQSTVSLSGTSAAESVYYINGLNVTDQRSFLGYTDLPFEAIQTIDTKTGGYQAEFGRGTGGVVNIITRSGGNEWHGGLSAQWTPDTLRSTRGLAYAPGGTNSAGQLVYNQTARADSNEQTIWFSGPLLRDHIFLFGLYNTRFNESQGGATFTSPTASNGTVLHLRYNDPRWLAKVDFVLNENHRLEYTIFSDKSTSDYQPLVFNKAAFEVTGLGNAYWQQSGGVNQILKYTGVFTDWFTLSALYGKVNSDYKDYGPNINFPGILDYGALGGSYVTNGRQAGPFNIEGEDERTTYRIDADFYVNNLMGDHHFRVGYDREDLSSSAISAYSGGALYYAYAQADCPDGASDQGCVELLTFANVGTYEAEQSAWYVQDSWDVTPNLSLQLGVRADIYDYKNAVGQTYISIEDQYAPRLGFNWDPTGEKVSRVYGSVGDYYLPIATNTSIRASSGEVYTDQYFQTERTGPCIQADDDSADDFCTNGLIINGGFPVVGDPITPVDYYSPPGAPDPRAVIEEGLEPMYEREWILGYEHRFTDGMFADWKFGVRGVYRDLQSTIEDTAIGDAVARYCVRTGTTCIAQGYDASDPEEAPDFSSLFPFVLVNPGDGARVYVDFEGDTRTDLAGDPNPDYNPQWIDLTAADLNLPEVDRTYKALEFTFERPFDGRWGVQGSYTLAKSEGNYEGAVKSDIGQTDTSITQDFDHHANQLNADGPLPNDHRHTFKAFGSYQVTDRFRVGALYTLQSGRPYGCLGTVPRDVDPLAPDSGTPSGWFCPRGTEAHVADDDTGRIYYDRLPTPRGSQGETDWVSNLDLGFQYKILPAADGGEEGGLTASMDILNVFDEDAVTRVVEQGEIRTAAGDVKGQKAPFYGMPRTYQAARSVRFGLRWSF